MTPLDLERCVWLRWCFGRCLFFGRCLWRRWCSGRCRAWLRGVPGSLRCLWCRWCSGGMLAWPLCVLVSGGPLGRAALCARGRRPAREPSARRVDSLSGQAPPPPTGTAARPRHRPRAPQQGLDVTHPHRGLAPSSLTGTAAPPCRYPGALRPVPATAHGHRSQALPQLIGTVTCPCRRPRVPLPGATGASSLRTKT